MNSRWICVAATGALAVASAFAQSAADSKPASKKAWSAPRLADGHPDLQGTWTNATLTPLERPAQFANQPFLTKEETAKAEAQARGLYTDVRNPNAERDRDHAYNSLFFDRGQNYAVVDGQVRSSLIVDPPDGKIPRVPGARAMALRRAAAAAAGDEGAGAQAVIGRFDSVKDRPLGERCLLGFGSTSGPPMMPVLYNNNYQIVQTPDRIMILVEMVHDVRLIRMNSEHLPGSIRKWLGDSVGHWEGDTLLVDTTNFTDKTHYQGATRDLHVMERFKRVDDHTILYRFTVEDPKAFTRAWSAEYPFLATPGPIYEYACHEGNYAMPDILGGARKEDDAAKKGSTK